jgi:hypothetical protein
MWDGAMGDSKSTRKLQSFARIPKLQLETVLDHHHLANGEV